MMVINLVSATQTSRGDSDQCLCKMTDVTDLQGHAPTFGTTDAESSVSNSTGYHPGSLQLSGVQEPLVKNLFAP